MPIFLASIAESAARAFISRVSERVGATRPLHKLRGDDVSAPKLGTQFPCKQAKSAGGRGSLEIGISRDKDPDGYYAAPIYPHSGESHGSDVFARLRATRRRRHNGLLTVV